MRIQARIAAFAAAALLCLAPAGFAAWHCGDIELGSQPLDIVADPLTGDLFITTAGGQIARVDEATYQVSTIQLPGQAASIALDAGARLVYTTHANASILNILNIDTSDTSLVSVGAGPGAMAVDAVRARVFVVNSGDSTVSVIESGTVSDTLLCAGRPAGIAIDPATGRGFATIPELDLLMAFEASSGDTEYFATGPGPDGIEIDPEKGELYIATTGTSAVSVFSIGPDSLFDVTVGGTPVTLSGNPETGKVFVATTAGITVISTDSYATEDIALALAPQAIAVDALSDRAFASLPGLGRIVGVTSAGDTSLVSVPGTPGMLSVNPVTDKVYFCNPAAYNVGVIDAADYFSGFTVRAGGGPGVIRINYETHMVYCSNWFTANVTVIDGLTNAVSGFDVADGPNTLRINPVTDDIYVVCAWSNLLTVKRNGQSDTLNAPLGGYSRGIAFNQNTGKLFVTNRFTQDMSVVDMQTLDTTMVRMGGYPCNVVASLEHNRIYVVNRTSWTLSVVEGATLENTFVRIGHKPTWVVLNPNTDKVYIIEPNSRSVSEVDAVTLERVKIPVGTQPSGLGVNPNTNTIFVASRHDGEVTVVDGATHRRTPVRCGYGLGEQYPDIWINRLFAVSWDDNIVTLVDGNFLSTLTIPVGEEPHNIEYDPVLEKLYVANHAGNTIKIMQLRNKITPRITASVDALPSDVAYTTTPTVTGSVSSTRSPNNFGIMKVLYKVDNLRGSWREATIAGDGPDVNWTLTTDPLALGTHLLFVVALDSTACSLSSSSSSSLQHISDIVSYEMTCLSPAPEPPVALDASGEGEGIEIAWTPTCGEGGWYELELASDPNFGENVTRIPHISEPGFTIEPALMAASACYWRVAAVDYPHGKRSAFSDRFRVEDVGTPGFAPDAASLGAYPNPARGDVMLRLIIPVDKSIECDIYDVEGRLVATLPMWAGEEGMSATWSTVGSDGKAVPPGVYFAKIKTPGVDLQRKVVLIR